MANSKTTKQLIGANEDMFLQAFDSTPKLHIATQKKLENELARVISIISNQAAEWDQRVQAMKLFRSLVNSGIADQDDFYSTTLRNLEIPFQNNICDLRSQVVRETCITIAFLSCRLQQKFSRMAEILLPSLIKLIPNSAKIVSTSALVALRFIIQSTHSSKFVSIIKYQLSNSKSKDIHRALCEIIERIATLWPPQVIDRHINDFVEVLRLGICDSDEMARQYSRRAFNAFAEHFREHAERLFNSLDGQRQRMLNNLNHGGGSTLSMNGYGGSATSGLNTIGSSMPQQQQQNNHHQSHHAYSAVTNNHNLNVTSSGYGQQPQSMYSQQGISRLKSSLTSTSSSSNSSSSASNNSSIPAPPLSALAHVYQSSNRTTGSPSRIRTPTARSTSAIDVDAQRRARARAVYLSSMYQRPRQLVGASNNNITPSPIKSNLPQPIHTIQSPVVNQSPLVTNNSTASTYGYKAAPSTPMSHGNSTTIYHTPQSVNRPLTQYNHAGNHDIASSVGKLPQHQATSISDQVAQHHPAVPAEKTDGEALSKAAAYLLSVMKDSRIDESQIRTTIKYFNTLIDKHSPEIISQLISVLMPPLAMGVDNAAISVRKATVFAMVSIYAKVGLDKMEPYLTSLTMTQRKLLEVYIKKYDEESQK